MTCSISEEFLNFGDAQLHLLNRKTLIAIAAIFIVASPTPVTLAKTDWSKPSSNQGQTAKDTNWKEFVPRKGKADFDGNSIVGCGSPKKSYQILFGGTPEKAVCQIGVAEPYRQTKRDIEFGEYDIHGTSRTKCADALTKLPQDIYVPSPTKHAVWCPYDHPKIREFSVNSENAFINGLKDLALKSGNQSAKTLQILVREALALDPNEAQWRKGFSGLYPNHATDLEPAYGRKERKIARAITEQQSLMITAYLFADEKDRSLLAENIAQLLTIYEENDAFEYLFNTPFSQQIKSRDSSGGEGVMFDDYTAPGYWDNSATMGLNYFLPGIINLYSILKSEMPSDKRLSGLRQYVQKLVWLNEQGLDYGVINADWPNSPESANHHSASRAFIHLLWGVADGSDEFFQAGANHYVSVIQDSRTDGSIISEVKPSPSEKSTHGGWGSIDRNNETLGYHALSAILIDSQGYDVNSISINGVNLEKNIGFGVAVFFDPSVAEKWSKAKSHSEQYKNDPSDTTNTNLSWYLLSSLMLGYEPNDKIVNFVVEDKWHSMAQNLGLIDVRFFQPLNEKSLFSDAFDGLTCGYQILKRGYDKEKNKNYEYTVNLGRFVVEDGLLRFGKNIWKVGGIKLGEDYIDASAKLFVQKDGSITGTFPVFTSTKKKKTAMVEIKRSSQGASLASTSHPIGEFEATRDGSESAFIFRVNACN